MTAMRSPPRARTVSYTHLEDTDRQALNVYRMELLGAKVHPVTSGTQTLKDAVNETLREWTNPVSYTHLLYAASRGVRPDEIMAIGDSENDYSMLSMDIKYTVAMGNAMAVSYTHLDVYKRQV